LTGSFVPLRRLAALSVAITVIASSVVTAQTPESPRTDQSTFLATPAFAELIKGKKIAITTKDGGTQTGTFTVSSAGLTLKGKGHSPVSFDQVATVHKITHRVRNDAIAGFTLGFLIGLPVVLTGYCEDEGCSGDGQVMGLACLYGGIGAAAGAAIGAALNAHNRERDILYDAKRRTTTIAFAPILSATRRGVAFSMTWR